MKAKKILLYFLVFLLSLVAVFAFQNYPFSSSPKKLSRLCDTSRIRADLEMLTNTPAPRNYKNTAVLDSIAGNIALRFSQTTPRVYEQAFVVKGKTYKNIIASFGPENAARIIVGAHYDVCGNQDGADDNASGVAGLLELARLLQDSTLHYRIDLVAYTLEEPPFFNTAQMGSYIHAKSLHDSGIAVKGMVSLEMLGYYSEEEDSQGYPLFPLKWIYGSKGNYITVVQKSFRGAFVKQFREHSFETNSIAIKSFRAPSFLGGVDLSDHKNYWTFGYSAVMVTNTAFFRNHNYHEPSDKLQTLDIGKMGLAVDGVFRTLLRMD